MPKKLTNNKLINDYIEYITNENKLSPQTLKTYVNIANNLPFNVLTSQPTIIKKLKTLYDNGNTLALNLNMIILVRKHNSEEVDKLLKFRNSLLDTIKTQRKTRLDKLDEALPSYSEIKQILDKLTGVDYIVNYLMINNGLRNKDLNLQFVKEFPEETAENMIRIKGKNALLNINSYKTQKSHGEKNIKVSDPKFIQELKKLKLTAGDYLIPMKDGSKMANITTFNDKVKRLSILKLGQNKLIKIHIKHLLNNKQFDTLEQIGRDRGTSLSVLLTSYNLENGHEQNIKED